MDVVEENGEFMGLLLLVTEEEEVRSSNTSTSVNSNTSLVKNDESSPLSKKRKKYFMSEDALERRRERRRVKFPLPKLLKDDIRRLYANMLVNVSNSFDLDLVRSFFTRFCIPECILDDCSPQFTEYCMYSRVVAKGVDPILHCFQEFVDLFPDSVMKINSNIQIKIVDMVIPSCNTDESAENGFLREHSHSIIECQFRFDCMMLYVPLNDTEFRTTRIYSAEEYVSANVMAGCRLQNPPIPVSFMATMKMFVNKDFFITRISTQTIKLL